MPEVKKHPDTGKFYVVAPYDQTEHPLACQYLQKDGSWNWHSPHYFDTLAEAKSTPTKLVPPFVCTFPGCKCQK